MAATTTVKKHPIRGLFWGLIMGLGLALILIGRKVIAFGDTTSFIVVVLIGVAISLAWSLFGPAKDPKGPEPIPEVEVIADDVAVTDDTASTGDTAFADDGPNVESASSTPDDDGPPDVVEI